MIKLVAALTAALGVAGIYSETAWLLFGVALIVLNVLLCQKLIH